MAITTTITLNGKAAQEITREWMDIQFPLTITVNIDPNTARRNTTVWLVSEVGNMLIGGTPQLVVADRTLWRVPALLTSSKIGTVGQVGTVDVDAVTGKLLVHKELIAKILNNAQELYHTTHPSNGQYIPECETSYPSHTFSNWMKDIAYQLAPKWSWLTRGARESKLSWPNR